MRRWEGDSWFGAFLITSVTCTVVGVLGMGGDYVAALSCVGPALGAVFFVGWRLGVSPDPFPTEEPS